MPDLKRAAEIAAQSANPPSWIRRHGPALCLLVLVWLRFAGSLFGGTGHLYLIDTALIDVPFRVEAARLLRAGEFPFWTTTWECGFPLFADGQTGVLYPFFAIYFIWPSPLGNDLFIALHYLLMALGMYAYLANRDLNPWAAALGAAAYMGGPMMLATHVIPGFSATWCWLPLTLLCLDSAAHGDPYAIWLCALFNSFIILAGIPNSTLICFLLQLAYLMNISWRAGPVVVARRLAVVFGLPLFMSAIQLWPTYEYFRQSHRGGGNAWEAVTYNCLYTWQDFFTMGVSRAVNIPNSWPSFVAVCLLSFAALLPSARGRHVVFWIGLALFGVAIAVGTPLLRLLYLLPVINWFRWPMLYALLTNFALCVLIAIGANAVLNWISAKRSAFAVAATTVFIIVLTWLATRTTIAECKSNGDYYSLGSKPLINAARGPEHFRLLPLLHGAIEGREPDEPQQFWTEKRMEQSALVLSPNYSALHYVPVAILKNQIDAVTPRELTEIIFSKTPPSFNVLRCAGVTHLSDINPLPSHFQEQTNLLANEPAYAYTLKSPGRRAWMVYATEIIPERSRRLSRINEAEFDPTRTAIVEQPLTFDPPPHDRPLPKIVCSDESSQKLRVDVDTPAAGLLVVADRFAPEIETTVDGEPAELLRANHAFRGVVLPKGKHRVEMEYVPRAFYRGAMVSAVGLVILGLGLVQGWRIGRASQRHSRRTTE